MRKTESKISEEVQEIEAADLIEEALEVFDINSSNMESEIDKIVSLHNETIDIVEEAKVFDVKGILKFEEAEKGVYGDDESQNRAVTKEVYESMTDKEKAEWVGIDENDFSESVERFLKKTTSIGISYKYSSDALEEICRLEEACRKESDKPQSYKNTDRGR